MKDIKYTLIGASFLLAGLSDLPLASAQQRDMQAAWSTYTRQHGVDWKVVWAPEGDRAIRLEGATAAKSGTPSIIADSFVESNSVMFGFADPRMTKKRLTGTESLVGNHYRYRQFFAGLPVFNGSVDVHVDKSGKVYLVQSSLPSPSRLIELELRPVLAKWQAAERARASLEDLQALDKYGRPRARGQSWRVEPAELGIYRVGDTVRLAYRQVLQEVEVVVDANSGAVLKRASIAKFVNGSTKIFDPNPVAKLNNGALTDQNDTDYAALAGAYVTSSLLSITVTVSGTTKQYMLKGPYVETVDLSFASSSCSSMGSEVRDPPPFRSDTKFLYNRSEAGFEHVMAYRHIDKSQRAVQSLGFKNLINRPIRVDARAFDDDNSMYCADPVGAGYLAFGTGGVDDAEDADVVLHEYGHALQDAATPGGFPSGSDADAMGEGFGDYWAYNARASITGGWGVCFSEWDWEGSTPCARRLDTNLRAPGTSSDPHENGQIWSRGLRDLRNKISATAANKIILESHYHLGTTATFADGVEAMLVADKQLFGAQYKDAICSVFADRAINAPGCGYWVRMSWNKLGTDVDLHIRPPSGAGHTEWNFDDDVAFYNENPDWGVIDDPEDDPLLYRDCITTCISEQITVDKLTDVGTYRVMAHYYRDHGRGPTTVTVEVFGAGKLLDSKQNTLSNSDDSSSGGQVWFTYDIVVSPSGAVRLETVDTLVAASANRALAGKQRIVKRPEKVD